MPVSPIDPDGPLLAVSRRYGGDPAFVLAGGGNTSFKTGDRLWVKASGHALATIGPDGFVEMDRAALDDMLTGDWPVDPVERESLFVRRIMAARVRPELGQRPSVETLLHHLLPDSLVVHTHPGVVNALTCCVDGERLAHDLFGDDVVWQPYVDPGLVLAQSLQFGLSGQRPKAILLQNHGLIVGSDTAGDIAVVTDDVVARVRSSVVEARREDASGRLKRARWDAEALGIHGMALRRVCPALSIVADDSAAARWIAANREVALAGPLTPDQIVYCRSVPLWIEDVGDWPTAVEDYVRAYGVEPWVAVVAGAGVIAFRDSLKLAEITRAVYVDATGIARDAAALGGVRALGERDRRFIEQWEVEAHRRSVMAGTAKE